MIGPSANVQVYLACGVTDMRRGIDGLSALVEGVIRQAPGSGAIFGFRGRRADRIKLLWWDGQGFCLFLQGFGTRILPMAGGQRWRCASDAGSVVDARRGDRLAATDMDVSASSHGLKALFCKGVRGKILALKGQISYIFGYGNNAATGSGRAICTACIGC